MLSSPKYLDLEKLGKTGCDLDDKINYEKFVEFFFI